MTYDASQQHGPEGADHMCLFCGNPYWCTAVHIVHAHGMGNVMPGGRCCVRCRTQNILALDKLDAARRRTLYVG